MNRLKRLWSRPRVSFWFVHSLMVALSMMLAISLIELDSSGQENVLARWPRVFGASAEGARGILSTMAVMCVDYLNSILSRLSTRGIHSTHRYESEHYLHQCIVEIDVLDQIRSRFVNPGREVSCTD